MICYCYLYDKKKNIRFYDNVGFISFNEMHRYIDLLSEINIIVERIVDIKSNIIYYDDMPEGVILMMK